MTWLYQLDVDDSGDELPDLADILGQSKKLVSEVPFQRNQKARRAPCSEGCISKSPDLTIHKSSQAAKILSPKKNRKGLQHPFGPLAITNPNPLLPIPNKLQREDKLRSSPRRAARSNPKYTQDALDPSDDEDDASQYEEDNPFTDLSGFIVSDSESLVEDPPKTPNRIQRKSSRKEFETCSDQNINSEKEEPQVVNLISPDKQCRPRNPDDRNESLPGKPPLKLSATSDLDEPFALLRFSPPLSRSPHKIKEKQGPLTPPSSPIKPRLQSPSKKAPIPPTPHRPSIDAFWSQDVINDWNDQYSPRKTPKSIRRHRHVLPDDSEDEISPIVSPRKSPSKSPAKKDRTAIAQRKAFNDRKHDLALSFLAEVDQALTKGQVAQLSSSTGGIQIKWSKKLSSTAGRANWRREAIRHRLSDGTTTTTTHRHHASIELAEKVIDDEDRLRNVIAHEYCHLATFMISGVKNNPHGKEFKSWATKCSRAFGDRGIEVTTKHSYAIAYKYIWVCENAECGIEYKRHSKSIDPAKHTCGKCKGRLLQIQPAPRKGAEAGGKKSEYQEFVKREYERVRMANPGKGFGELMAVLGWEFRETKKVGVEVREVLGMDEGHRSVDGMVEDLGQLSLAV